MKRGRKKKLQEKSFILCISVRVCVRLFSPGARARRAAAAAIVSPTFFPVFLKTRPLRSASL